MSRDVQLVKLGGSLITDKRTPETLRPDVLTRLAREVVEVAARIPEAVLLGHGSGSFGHHAAACSGLNAGPCDEEQLLGAARTQEQAAVLHGHVIRALHEAGGRPFSLAPSSFITAAAGRPVNVRAEPLLLALSNGLMPVVFGDVVLDREWGASICSTETVFLSLVPLLQREGLRVRRALWLGETEGIYDENGATVSRIDPQAAGHEWSNVGGAEGSDVTGGMRHRLESVIAMAGLGVPSRILDGRVPGRLERALFGEDVPGTEIVTRADAESSV